MSSTLDFEIPGYDIIEPIGRGGMASVYRARQHTFDRNVALKILKPDLSEDDAFCQRFVMESLIVAKLNHSHIVQVYDVGEVKNNYFIAMEFLSHGDLQSRLKRGLATAEAVSIIKQIASALDFAHRKNIIHRDLKPDNIMFREDDAAVLTDFGIAKETNADINLTQTGLIVGTPKYMSPEQIRGATPSSAGDIYSLGIMFYQLLVGRVPFEGADLVSTAYMHFNEPVPKLPDHLSYFQELVDSMLAKSIEDRINHGNDVVKELNRLQKLYPLDMPEKEEPEIQISSPSKAIDDDQETVVSGQHSLEEDAPTVLSTSVADETSITPEKIDQALASQPTEVKSKIKAHVDAATGNTGEHASTPSENNYNQANNGIETGEHPTEFRPQPKTPFIYAGLGVAVLVGIITVGIIFSQGTPEDSNVEKNNLAAQQAELNAAEEKRQHIAQLLQQARLAFNNQRLTKGNDSALSKYQQILALEANNTQALEGVKSIVNTLVTLSDNEIEQGNLNKAQTFLDTAQQLDNNIDTSEQQTRLQKALEELKNPEKRILSAMQEFQISGLLKNAELYEKDGNTFSPKGANAAENYRKVLAIDPNHEKAKAELARLESSR